MCPDSTTDREGFSVPDSSSPSDSSETITVTKRSALLALGAGILAIALVAGVAIAALVRTTDDPQPKNTAAEASETSQSEEPGKGEKDEKKKDDKGDKTTDSDKDKREDKDGAKSKDSKKDSDKKSDSSKKKIAATSTAKPYSSGGSSKNGSSGSDKTSKGSGSSKSDKSSKKSSSSPSSEKTSNSSRTSESTPASSAPSTSDATTSPEMSPTDSETTTTTDVPADGFTVTSAEPTVEELDSLVQFLVTTDASDEAKAQSLENGMLGVGIPQFLAGLGVGDDPQGEARVVGPLERSGDSITATLEYTAEGQTRLNTPVVFTNSGGVWKLSATSVCAAAEGSGAPVGC